MDTGKKVSVSAENQSVDAVIEQILRGQELTYEIRDKNVIIRKKTSSIKETSKKAIEVIGTVLDSKGVPIIGANVVIKGTTMVRSLILMEISLYKIFQRMPY